MAGGTKRAAEENSSSRATKVAKTTKKTDAKGNGADKTATKPKISTADFKAKALPLHVSLTHSPPTIVKDGEIDENGKEEKAPETTQADIGFIGNLTLVPSSFSTGSYGWKGSKRIVVELQGGDSDEEGHKEKVQVMLSINATVVGSKPEKAKPAGKGKKGKKAAEEEDVSDEDKVEHADDLEDPEDA